VACRKKVDLNRILWICFLTFMQYVYVIASELILMIRWFGDDHCLFAASIFYGRVFGVWCSFLWRNAAVSVFRSINDANHFMFCLFSAKEV
jgi:hypothetical protein